MQGYPIVCMFISYSSAKPTAVLFGFYADDYTLGPSSMDIAEQIGVYVFATVVQLPFHLVIALPWLLLAWAVAAFTQQRVRAHTRLVLVSGIAAVGLAPAYGTHLSLLPIYTLVIGGEAQPVRVAVSFLTTWVLILLVGLAITWLRGRRQPPGSNPLLQRDAPTSGAPLS